MRFLIDRKITITMLFIAITFLGYISYNELSMELLPEADAPTCSVRVSCAGSSFDPSYVESEVIVPLEGVAAQCSGVEQITSTVRSTGGTIDVEFKSSVNIKSAYIRLSELITQYSSELPDEFTVSCSSASSSTSATGDFMTLRVKGDMDVDEILAIVETDVEEKLANIEGISAVTIYGGRSRSVEVALNSELCDALGLTTQRVTQSLTNAGNERTFVGYARDGALESSVFVDCGYSTIDMIGNVVVSASGPVYLKDVATITSEYKEPTTISRLDGERAITVALNSESGENIIELAERTRSEIESLNAVFSQQGITIVVDSCSADEIEENIAQLLLLGLIGALMAVAILWFFLHNIKLVATIALAIPISVFAAFNVFYAMGITINSITLIGITLAVGMLLDNSIVVLENIYRLSSEGRTPEQAVMEGTKQVWRSIFASTLTTITVFLPFVFTSDITIALMGYNLGVSIIATLLFSLAVALLLIPMLTYVILSAGRKTQSVFSSKATIHERPVQIYTILLKSVMRNSTLVLCLTLALLVVTFIWAASTTDDSMTSVSSDRITISLTMSSDSDVTTNDAIVANFEKKLKDIPELEEMSCTVGEESASIVLNLKDDFDVAKDSRQIGEIVNDVWARISSLRQGLTVNVSTGTNVSSQQGGGGGGSNTTMLQALGIGDDENTLLIKGTDYELMTSVGEDIEDILSELEYIGNVRLSTSRASNEVALDLDQYIVNELGITQSAMSYALMDLSTETESGAEIKFGDDEIIDITITMIDARATEEDDDDEDVKSLQDLYELQVESSSGGFYDMQNVAYIYTTEGESTIQRVDRSRELTLTYSFALQDLTDDIMESYNTEIDALIAEYPMPSGVVVEREESEDSFAEFKFLIFASVMLIFMILASVFESLVMPLVLMMAIPLAAIGSFVALIITDNSLMNLNTLTGFMILLGVVVNGGIILIDYINILRRKGYSRNRAIIMSGAMRLRPIMITTITTIIALLPMALGDDDYAGAIGAPFAITVIGGLSFSSLLTLILVPTLYLFLEEALAWYRGLKRWVHLVHVALLVFIAVNVWFGVDGVYTQMGYIALAVIVIPAVTYMIMHSVRIANSRIISSDEPIVIEARNLVKIYDRAGRFEREWLSANNRRASLEIENKYEKSSDLKPLIWQSVVAAALFAGATLYFESGLWITLMLIGWAILTIAILGALHRYYLNRLGRAPRLSIGLVGALSKSIVAIIALWVFATKTENYGVTGIYVGVIIIGCIIYSTARMIERKGINVARLEGRFATLKAIYFNAVLAVPIIGRSRTPFEALKGVSFTIKSGMFGLLGPNGAGKSTFMRIVTGLYEPSYGSIHINGFDTRTHREELQSLIGFLPQEFGTYEYMSAWDFLDYQAILKGVSDATLRRERVEYVLRSVHMYEKRDSLISSFSGGMKQRIGIAMILLNLPRILVVDEPTAGLDPRERIRFRNLLVELSRERVVIFSTHIIEDIASSCNQVAVVNRGALKFFGNPNDMLTFADKKVWSFTVSEEEFSKIDTSLVANNMKNSDGSVKVRYISPQKPLASAVQEVENLEDAYLCLLKDL